MTTLDPFSILKQRIEQILSEHVPLTNLVPEGNRVTDDDAKSIVKDGDFGEWRVMPYSGGGVDFRATSHASKIVQNYAIGLVAGNKKVTELYFPLKWSVIQAFGVVVQQETETLGLPFLVSFRLIDNTDTMMSADEDMGRGYDGWMGLTVFSAMMMLSPTEMQTAIWRP